MRSPIETDRARLREGAETWGEFEQRTLVAVSGFAPQAQRLRRDHPRRHSRRGQLRLVDLFSRNRLGS